MIKVVDIVMKLIENDEVALEAMNAGLLNFSAYAKKIHAKVADLTLKPVQKGTIVVALTRIAKKKRATAPRKPDIELLDIEMKSSVFAITFENTVDIKRKIAVLNPFLISTTELFAVTEGPTEITIICSNRAQAKILKHFNVKAMSEVYNLVGLTVRFDPKYREEPNFFYTLLSALASKRIPVISLIPTTTEVSFVIPEKFLEESVQIFNTHFLRKNKGVR